MPHPHGGRAIPLSERQVISLREKNRALEAKLAELIQFGEENDAIGEKVQRLALALLGSRDLDGMLRGAVLQPARGFPGAARARCVCGAAAARAPGGRR